MEKKNWMSSVQLWNNTEDQNKQNSDQENDAKMKEVCQSNKGRAEASAFMPIKGYSAIPLAAVRMEAKTTSSQTSRKQRRCWSPELHRRFVAALEKLGGAQVATPKQIRELMQIDGLTNDEVKSHLQMQFLAFNLCTTWVPPKLGETFLQ